MNKPIYTFTLFMVVIAFYCCKNDKHNITLVPKDMYEITYDDSTITIKYQVKDKINKESIRTWNFKYKNGEYHSCDKGKLFMSVKRDTSFTIYNSNNEPHTMHAYIGSCKHAPSYISLPIDEKRKDLFLSIYYSESDYQKDRYDIYRLYIYDKDYNIISITQLGYITYL